MTFAVEVEDLRKVYRANRPDKVEALAGISFQIPVGRIQGLLGPNGAGKSTLVKILGTIIKPSSGRASILGLDVERHDLAARQRMAVVLQQTASESLLTVEDNLIIYAYLHGIERRAARKRAQSIAEEFDLMDKLRSTVQELSEGTKRRIQVAKVFMLDSPVIILDEATTGMDPIIKRRVMERLRAEAKKGRTVLLTTQVLSEAEQLCDSILIIHHGRVLAGGTLRELRRLSEQMFRVTVSFAHADEVPLRLLEALQPIQLTVEDNYAEFLMRGEETSLLEKLTEISRQVPITQFEVRGPDLEEVFMTLTKEA